jgi:hypothetical protein
MRERIFILIPNGQNDKDIRHDVCRTMSKRSLRDIYMDDDYDVIEACYSLPEAIQVAKKHGAKRPTVI